MALDFVFPAHIEIQEPHQVRGSRAINHRINLSVAGHKYMASDELQAFNLVLQLLYAPRVFARS